MEPTETIARPSVIELLDAAISSPHAPETLEIEGINWRVSLDDYWVIGARPGSGKSNLLAVAAGLQRPARGTHRLFGRETTTLHEHELARERSRIGLVFEMGGRLFSHLTVAENVALPLRYHRDWPEEQVQARVAAVLELTGIAYLAARTPARVVRALQPRVGLARALALNPEVLLLDNPLAGLDPRQARWWLDFLAALAAGHEFFERRRMTLVVASDDLRPWMDRGCQFALVKDRRWLPLGGREAAAACMEPLLRELLAAEFAAD